ncbi:MAG: SDR family oxidoreductase [Pseudomonadota bacterium]
MDLGLDGRVALVTGASKGIGLAVAKTLAAEGCDVAMVARNEQLLMNEAEALAAATGRKITAQAADLTEKGAPAAVVSGAVEAHGRLDILVNNAGAAKAGDFFDDLTDDDWDDGYLLKFHGYVRTARAAFPHLENSGHGIVINNIGAAAKQPKPGFLLGASINAALNSFTKGLAQIGLERGVRVVSMNSGPMRTDRLQTVLEGMAAESGEDLETLASTRAKDVFGMWRYGDPQDLANLAAFLASDRAQHIHGSNIFIDGGQTKEL